VHTSGDASLQNVAERAVILCEGDTFSIDETWLTRESKTLAEPSIPICTSLPQQQWLQSETERQMIRAAAAAKLGIPRQTLDSKIAALGIDKHRYKVRRRRPSGPKVPTNRHILKNQHVVFPQVLACTRSRPVCRLHFGGTSTRPLP